MEKKEGTAVEEQGKSINNRETAKHSRRGSKREIATGHQQQFYEQQWKEQQRRQHQHQGTAIAG